jgi:hypothetical protein
MNSNRLATSIRACGQLLIIFAIVAVATSSRVTAQTPEPPKTSQTVRELREKLQQLEQAMMELKGQINAVEQRERGTDAASPTAGYSPDSVQKIPGGPSAGASAGDLVVTRSAAGAEKVTTPASPKPQASSGESTFEVYGFAMLDMGYEFKSQHPDWFDVIRPTKLPSFKGEFAPDGKFYAGVRQTRFGVKSSTPTAWGDLKTQFEFELYGTGVDAGQTTFRLRHAYGELGQFGAGQYWSPFMDIDVFPNSLEYWGPNGMVFFRNVQVRWMPIKGQSFVTVALERPGASADQGVYADRIELQGVRPKLEYPDLSAEARLGRKWGYVEIAGIVRQLKWRDTNNDQFDLGGSDIGWGVNLSSNLKFGKATTGRFQFVYGEGIQNYMNDAPVDVGVVNNLGDRRRPVKGVALPVTGIVAFLDHNWNKGLSTAIGYSMLDIQNSAQQAANAFNQGHYALTNLLWSPIQNFTVGAEFQFGRRTNFSDGYNANDYRMQFSFKYNFSKLLKF